MWMEGFGYTSTPLTMSEGKRGDIVTVAVELPPSAILPPNTVVRATAVDAALSCSGGGGRCKHDLPWVPAWCPVHEEECNRCPQCGCLGCLRCEDEQRAERERQRWERTTSPTPPAAPPLRVDSAAELPVPPVPMKTRNAPRDLQYLLCTCRKGISYTEAALEQHEIARMASLVPGARRHRLEPFEDLARALVTRGYVKTDCGQKKLEEHFAKLKGAFRAPPGVVRRTLIDAVDDVDMGVKFDLQHETVGGQLKHYELLEDLKEKRDQKAALTGKSSDTKGYQRPARKHRGMAHSCELHHARLDFYGKSWIRGKDADGVPNVEKRAYALEMDHLTLQHYELVNHLKEIFWSELNKASQQATYNSVICMRSRNNEHVGWHSDTLVPEKAFHDCPYVEGAAILVVMKGMRQMLHTRGLTCGPFAQKKSYDFPLTGVPCIELEDGCAYMIPAGEVGSVDYLVEHMTDAHASGPGKEWEGEAEPERNAWVYRAIRPSHAQWYSQHWPHQMLPPTLAAKLYGVSNEGPVVVWG